MYRIVTERRWAQLLVAEEQLAGLQRAWLSGRLRAIPTDQELVMAKLAELVHIVSTEGE